MIRRTPTSNSAPIRASAAFLAVLFALGLASAQEGNPLDRPRPRPETGSGPAWAGIFLDESEEMVFVLVPSEGADAKFEGVLAEQAAGPEGEYVVQGALREGTLEGSVEKQGQRYLFVAKMDEDTLVVTSGATTSRWRRAPGAPREVEQLRGLLARVRRGREQSKDAGVIGALRMLNTAQVLFREADKEGDGQLDYGTLEELAKATLVDEELGSGQKYGYRFEVRPSRSTPEFLWMATATPIEPGPEKRHYVTNQAGVVFYSTTAPFTWNDACSIPEDATPLGSSVDEHDEHDGHDHGGGQTGPAPDLSHVKVGQRYTYVMTNEGAPPMQMTYTVTAVDEWTVRYDIQTIMDLGQGPQPVGPPAGQEWSHVDTGQPPGDPPGSTREKMIISGYTFDALVFTAGTTKTFIPMSGSVPTFPGVLKVMSDGKTTMELTKIE